MFVLVVLAVGMIVVFVAMYGFSAVGRVLRLCGPVAGGDVCQRALVLFPAIADFGPGPHAADGLRDSMKIGDQSIWTGVISRGEPASVWSR